MDREQCKALLPVMTAFIEGRPTQFRPCTRQTEEWGDLPSDDEYPAFHSSALEWRVKPEKQKAWLTIYADGLYFLDKSGEVAKRNRVSKAVACFEVEYYEGQGLD